MERTAAQRVGLTCIADVASTSAVQVNVEVLSASVVDEHAIMEQRSRAVARRPALPKRARSLSLSPHDPAELGYLARLCDVGNLEVCTDCRTPSPRAPRRSVLDSG
jgi:hypothetical protein